MEKQLIPFLLILFTVVICFFVGNMAIGFIVPVFNQTASSMPFMNMTEYTAQTNTFVADFIISIFILLAIPFAYLLLRSLKKEPVPYQASGYY